MSSNIRARNLPAATGAVTSITIPTIAATDGSTTSGGPYHLFGWSCRETGGVATVTAVISDGNGGQVVANIEVDAGKTDSFLFAHGVAFSKQPYVTITGTGTLSGVIYTDA